jgi:hypothetical protein
MTSAREAVHKGMSQVGSFSTEMAKAAACPCPRPESDHQPSKRDPSQWAIFSLTHRSKEQLDVIS